MALQAGLVGLPNVGKSTLFNALTKSSIPAENFPFCTVDPHVALTEVPDARCAKLAKIFGSQKIIPAVMQFVDIAGLVKGASRGEGLGNQFLSNIMQTDLVIHVIRCFEDGAIIHVHNKVDPLSDFDDIVAELILKDMDSAEKRIEKLQMLIKSAKTKQLKPQEVAALEKELAYMHELNGAFNKGVLQDILNIVERAREENIQLIPLLSGKPYLIAANFDEDTFADNKYEQSDFYKKLVARFGEEKIIPVSARIEAELAQLSDADAEEMKASLGIAESGLSKLIRQTYKTLGLISFFTCGPKEVHTWTIKKNTPVQKAAGEIHSDLERGFIAAEVYNATDIFQHGSEAALKNVGKIRTEGKTYIMQDGDLVNIKFNV